MQINHFCAYAYDILRRTFSEETEAYISQLEGEQRVPEGKELIRLDLLQNNDLRYSSLYD